MLTVQRHWKIHFLLTLHSKFLRGTVAGVVHGEKRKTSAEMRERKKRWLFQVWGWPACGWASYLCGAGGGSGWWLERQGERGRDKKLHKQGRNASFWPTLDLKSTSIYRQWKRAILSSPGKNFQPLI
jgi:hypothetical protein